MTSLQLLNLVWTSLMLRRHQVVTYLNTSWKRYWISFFSMGWEPGNQTPHNREP
jgi:hypothetical protein